MCGVFLGVGIVINSAEAMEAPCRKHFDGAQFALAAECYKGLLKQVDQNPGVSEIRILLKDRYLVQAAISYNRAAQAAKTVDEIGLHKELAVEQVKHSLREGYCKASQRCLNHQRWVEQMVREIGYSTLIVVTGDEKAAITVSGLRISEVQKGSFNRVLRPGNYRVAIDIPGQKPRTRDIELRGNHRMVINVTPVQIQIVEKRIIIAKKVPPLVLAGYIAGGVLIAGGAALLIYGVVNQSQLNTIRQDPILNKEQSDDDYIRDFGNAQIVSISGGITAGTGVLVLVGGLIAHLAAAGTKTPPRIQLVPPEVRSTAQNRTVWLSVDF
jgi:hypothetical protein